MISFVNKWIATMSAVFLIILIGACWKLWIVGGGIAAWPYIAVSVIMTITFWLVCLIVGLRIKKALKRQIDKGRVG